MNQKHWTSWLAHVLAIICLACLAVPLNGTKGGNDNWFLPVVLLTLVTLIVGWFLAWRRPRTALSWMVLAIPFWFSVQVPMEWVGHALIPTNPTAAGWLLLIAGTSGDDMTWVLPIGLLLSQIPLRFPTGSLPSRRWRWFFWYTVAAIVTTVVLGSTGLTEVGYGVPNPARAAWGDAVSILTFALLGIGLLPSFVGSLASLFVRYRRAGTVERAQLRWVFWAAAVAIGLLILSWIPSLYIAAGGSSAWMTDSGGELALALVGGLGYSLIPIAILVAVMRFGLYGIDRIISRTLSYTIVVTVVVALYAGVVSGLAALIPNLPSVGVALATLAAAGVFLPLLRWVQRRINRYFNRAAYDAQQVVEAFGQRLRDGADPHTATADLLTAIDQTLQPSTLGVWARR
jgi:hypothetical protein